MAPDKAEQQEGRAMPVQLTEFERGFMVFCNGIGLLVVLFFAFLGAVSLWGWVWSP